MRILCDPKAELQEAGGSQGEQNEDSSGDQEGKQNFTQHML